MIMIFSEIQMIQISKPFEISNPDSLSIIFFLI